MCITNSEGGRFAMTLRGMEGGSKKVWNTTRHQTSQTIACDKTYAVRIYDVHWRTPPLPPRPRIQHPYS